MTIPAKEVAVGDAVLIGSRWLKVVKIEPRGFFVKMHLADGSMWMARNEASVRYGSPNPARPA